VVTTVLAIGSALGTILMYAKVSYSPKFSTNFLIFYVAGLLRNNTKFNKTGNYPHLPPLTFQVFFFFGQLNQSENFQMNLISQLNNSQAKLQQASR